MPYVVRKISRAKWDSRNGLAPEEIPADAVTSDLRTSGNTLSFWRLESPASNDEVADIVLALSAAGDRIDKLDLVWIDAETLDQRGVSLRDSDGRTPLVHLRQNHTDAVRLDANRLCAVATLLSGGLTRDQYKRFTKKDVAQILADAVRKGSVSLDELNGEMHEDIRKHL